VLGYTDIEDDPNGAGDEQCMIRRCRTRRDAADHHRPAQWGPSASRAARPTRSAHQSRTRTQRQPTATLVHSRQLAARTGPSSIRSRTPQGSRTGLSTGAISWVARPLPDPL